MADRRRQNNPDSVAAWRDAALRLNYADPDRIMPASATSTSSSKLKEEEFIPLRILWVNMQTGSLRLHLEKCLGRDELEAGRSTNTENFTQLSERSKQDPFGQDGQPCHVLHYFHFLIQRDLKEDEPPNPEECTPKIEKLRPRITYQPGGLNESKIARYSGMTFTPAAQNLEPETVTPATPSLFPRMRYEATVNVALILLLSSIRLESPHLGRAHWLPDPVAFRLRDEKFEPIIDARVDGYLSTSDRQTFAHAIVEVKPYVRSSNRLAIEWQEGAQMAAWISQTSTMSDGYLGGLLRSPSDGTFRRFMVSQDRHEIYVTIAEYDEVYVKYLTGKKRQSLATPAPAPFEPAGQLGLQTPGTPTPLGRLQGGSSKQKTSFGGKMRAKLPFRGTKAFTFTGQDDDDELPLPLTSGAQKPVSRTVFGKSKSRDPAGPSGSAAGSGRSSNAGFLVMNCFGPFDISNTSHMAKLVPALVSLTLQATGGVRWKRIEGEGQTSLENWDLTVFVFVLFSSFHLFILDLLSPDL